MKESAKKSFKMPHLMVIVFCLIFFMSAMTYVIPAGQFATDPQTGQLIGSEFHFLGHQTPVSPWQAMLYIKDGDCQLRHHHCNPVCGRWSDRCGSGCQIH